MANLLVAHTLKRAGSRDNVAALLNEGGSIVSKYVFQI